MYLTWWTERQQGAGLGWFIRDHAWWEMAKETGGRISCWGAQQRQRAGGAPRDWWLERRQGSVLKAPCERNRGNGEQGQVACKTRGLSQSQGAGVLTLDGSSQTRIVGHPTPSCWHCPGPGQPLNDIAVSKRESPCPTPPPSLQAHRWVDGCSVPCSHFPTPPRTHLLLTLAISTRNRWWSLWWRVMCPLKCTSLPSHCSLLWALCPLSRDVCGGGGGGWLSTMSVWPWWASKVPTPGAQTQQGLWRVALTGGHHCIRSVAGSAEPPTVPAPPRACSLCFSCKSFLPWGLTHKPGPHRPNPARKRVLYDQPCSF